MFWIRENDREDQFKRALYEITQKNPALELAKKLVSDTNFPRGRAELLCTRGQYSHDAEYLISDLVVEFLKRSDLNVEIVQRITQPLEETPMLSNEMRREVVKAKLTWLTRRELDATLVTNESL